MKNVNVNDVKDCIGDIAKAIYSVRDRIDNAYSDLEKIADALGDLSILVGELEETPKTRYVVPFGAESVPKQKAEEHYEDMTLGELSNDELVELLMEIMRKGR